jgi:vancomycin aglycone glucosyltransferase
MRVLLSTIGSRGDVQPLVALALALRALGQEVRLCVPPDFREWIEGLGVPVTPIGPEARKAGAARAQGTPAPPSPESLRQAIEGTVATQFDTVAMAAEGCDLIVAATALQIAAHSVAERLGIPYVFAAYSPTVLPSPHHAPIPLRPLGDAPAPAAADNAELWSQDARRWNEMWGPALNFRRTAMGLAPVSDVRTYMFTDRPWLAADATLAPWPDPSDRAVFQAGSWILPDNRPLSAELERFLAAGEPPVYFGFGSMHAPQDLSRVMIDTARAFGRRAIVSSGWAGLSVAGIEPDCVAVGEVNVQALFKRVAAVVHHGGAGTTTAAALAGAPQVVVPQIYDQHYWAQRIQHLGIGTAHAAGTPTAGSLTAALGRGLDADVAARARSISRAMRRDSAQAAARRLIGADPHNPS